MIKHFILIIDGVPQHPNLLLCTLHGLTTDGIHKVYIIEGK